MIYLIGWVLILCIFIEKEIYVCFLVILDKKKVKKYFLLIILFYFIFNGFFIISNGICIYKYKKMYLMVFVLK